jgi:molecular chaperone DnaK
MYKAAAASAPTDGAATAEGTTHEEPKKDEGVIDAEYVDVDEKK